MQLQNFPKLSIAVLKLFSSPNTLYESIPSKLLEKYYKKVDVTANC